MFGVRARLGLLRAETGDVEFLLGSLMEPLIQSALNPKPYLDPTEPTFLGLLIMISLYKSLKI